MTTELEKYLASGIIEMYCLGMASPDEAVELERMSALYPEVCTELKAAQAALVAHAQQFEFSPSANMEARILTAVDELKFTGGSQLDSFVDISEYSNVEKWKGLVKDISPPEEFLNTHRIPLFESEHQFLAVTWVKTEVPTESHDDRIEKILILEGTCRCRLGEEELDLAAGDCLMVPLNVVHNLKVTSERPVKMIYARELLRKTG